MVTAKQLVGIGLLATALYMAHPRLIPLGKRIVNTVTEVDHEINVGIDNGMENRRESNPLELHTPFTMES